MTSIEKLDKLTKYYIKKLKPLVEQIAEELKPFEEDERNILLVTLLFYLLRHATRTPLIALGIIEVLKHDIYTKVARREEELFRKEVSLIGG